MGMRGTGDLLYIDRCIFKKRKTRENGFYRECVCIGAFTVEASENPFPHTTQGNHF